jgi:hypothetical protein
MNHEQLRHDTILLSEGERHVLRRSTVGGEQAADGLLVSIPDDDPDRIVTIRRINIAVLCMAIECGTIQVLKFGPIEPRRGDPPLPSASRRRSPKRRVAAPALADLLREGHVFYGSELATRPRRRAGAARKRRTG